VSTCFNDTYNRKKQRSSDELLAVIFALHRMYCGLLLQMSHVAWSVCLSVRHTGELLSIEMPFGGWQQKEPFDPQRRHDSATAAAGCNAPDYTVSNCIVHWQIWPYDAVFHQNSLTICFHYTALLTAGFTCIDTSSGPSYGLHLVICRSSTSFACLQLGLHLDSLKLSRSRRAQRAPARST